MFMGSLNCWKFYWVVFWWFIDPRKKLYLLWRTIMRSVSLECLYNTTEQWSFTKQTFSPEILELFYFECWSVVMWWNATWHTVYEFNLICVECWMMNWIMIHFAKNKIWHCVGSKWWLFFLSQLVWGRLMQEVRKE